MQVFVCLLYDSHFFFSSRRRHTRFKCDWSSDVCSSDLDGTALLPTIEAMAEERLAAVRRERPRGPYVLGGHCNGALVAVEIARRLIAADEIGRAACRGRVEISVGAGSFKKKKRKHRDGT